MKKLFLILLLSIGTAQASLVGQSEPDEDGYVMCYYENFNDGTTWMRRSLYACSSQ